jgi:hypothetical protein
MTADSSLTRVAIESLLWIFRPYDFVIKAERRVRESHDLHPHLGILRSERIATTPLK